jgi:oligoendopeptidase F
MLAPFTPASDFVPAQLDASRWSELAPLYQQLIDRELTCEKCLERLILDRSELDACVSEMGSNLYIRMTCRTDDAAISKAYMDFNEQVLPPLKEASFALDCKIATSPHAARLSPARYGVLLRDIRLAVEMFRPENIALETQETRLQQEYQQINGAMMVTFRGKEHTLQQMAKYQEDTDRAVREEAWRLVAERRYQDRERIEGIFDQLLALRQRIAVNAGFANYRDYKHRAKRRFDYAPADCDSFAQGVQLHITPALRKIEAQRARALGLSRLRPWDTAVDVKGRSPLRPFENAEQLVERSKRVFDRMDPSLGAMFRTLADGVNGEACFDLESRKGKAPGGYQSMRDRARVPFIFMNAAGVQRDVETMVHEAGHAFHSILCRNENILAYRSEIPLEFCEVASMSMELTAHPYLGEFYSEADAQRAKRRHLEALTNLFPWVATIDQFQQWLYTNVGHTHQQRQAAWRDILARLGSDLDWSGIEHLRDSMWQRQPHLFGAPFYYIEYGIAQLGALQLWSNYRRDAAKAIADYKAGLSLGGSRPLKELFTAAGLSFDFTPTRIHQTWSEVEQELEKLPA